MQHLRRQVVGMLLSAATWCLAASDVQAAPSCHAQAVASPPALSSSMCDGVWSNTDTAGGFTRVMGEGPVQAQTHVRMVWSEASLCMMVHLEEPQAQVLRPKASIWESDRIELVLDPEPEDPAYFLFAVDCAGNREEGLFGSPDYEDAIKDWKQPWKAAVAKTNTGWCVTVHIPFATLGVQPKPGDVWKMNVCRQRNPANAPAEFSAWDPRFGGFHFAGSDLAFDPLPIPEHR